MAAKRRWGLEREKHENDADKYIRIEEDRATGRISIGGDHIRRMNGVFFVPPRVYDFFATVYLNFPACATTPSFYIIILFPSVFYIKIRKVNNV